MSVLDQILARKITEVAERRAARPDAVLEAALRDAPPVRDFAGALSPAGGPVRVVAEVKRASPSLGAIREGLDAVAQARRYAAAGAAAISVLTDGPGFGGSLDDLAAVRGAVDVPLLRKDFVVDRYQLLEARLYGADAALLIVAALDDRALCALLDDCASLGLAGLVETHDAEELARALAAGARIVGVNNRSLATFAVDLAASEALLPRLPPGVMGVAESGIRGPAEVRRLRACGAANFLVGEALVRADDPGALLEELTRCA
jgi:indole-3-glycerol phosphate synthase